MWSRGYRTSGGPGLRTAPLPLHHRAVQVHIVMCVSDFFPWYSLWLCIRIVLKHDFLWRFKARVGQTPAILSGDCLSDDALLVLLPWHQFKELSSRRNFYELFWQYGDLNSGLLLVKQMLYHLSHPQQNDVLFWWYWGLISGSWVC
jgi:hypothetical protein